MIQIKCAELWRWPPSEFDHMRAEQVLLYGKLADQMIAEKNK